jgi:hypothetical protein
MKDYHAEISNFSFETGSAHYQYVKIVFIEEDERIVMRGYMDVEVANIPNHGELVEAYVKGEGFTLVTEETSDGYPLAFSKVGGEEVRVLGGCICLFDDENIEYFYGSDSYDALKKEDMVAGLHYLLEQYNEKRKLVGFE